MLPEWGDLNDDNWDKFWFYGMEPNKTGSPNAFVLIIALIGNFYIWELKIKKKRGSVASILNDALYLLKIILKCNKRVNEERRKLHYVFCRELE
jgi:hypothetical protein